MEKQTLVFTTLPNGHAGDGRARVSLLVSPRLWSDDANAGMLPLSNWPDLLDWPARVAALGWSASIDGGAEVALDVENNALKPVLWAALFQGSTLVRPYLFEDHRGTPVESFPLWTVHDTLADLYGRASADPVYGAGRDRPELGVLAIDPDIAAIARPSFPEPPPQWNPPETADVPHPDAPPVTETPEEHPQPPAPDDDNQNPGCGCLAAPLAPLRWLLWKLFGWPPIPATGGVPPVGPEPPSSQPEPTPSFSTAVTPPPPAPPPPPGKSFLPPPLTPAQQVRHDAFEALHAFLQPFAGNQPPLPDAQALADTWDFHQAIAALGDYPEMLRRLGLVVDLLLPVGQVLPAAGTIRIAGSGAPFSAGTTFVTPRTHFIADAARFTAAPRLVDPEIIDGYLRVSDTTRFRVIQNDVVSDATKLRNAATHYLRFALAADRPAGLPGEGGLPALRTVGITLVRRDVAGELSQQFVRSCAINRFLVAQDGSPETSPAVGNAAPPPATDELYAEDLVRGYRVDVFDTTTTTWRSLSERNGSYRFLDAQGGPVDEAADDEGFVQFAATESRDPAAPPSIRTGETMFTWSGWSLAASRPGMAVMPDDSHADPGNQAVTPFRIETTFHARPGSLPRLRFGRRYRLRARIADLAGNSIAEPGQAAFDTDGPAVTPEFTALRYEPVAPPIVMLQSAPVEGESLERLVVRTPFDVPANAVAVTARHVAPPKTAQLLAELHGALDSVGGFDGSPASHALSARESNSVRDDAQQMRPALDGQPGEVPVTPVESDPWVQPAPFVTVSYLPDPQARGVAFTGLPGEATPDALQPVAFDGGWPDIKPFRIELKAIAVGQVPAAPAWQPAGAGDAGSGVLTVELPPAQRATVRINSLLDANDLSARGVWEWTKQQAPPNLATVESDVVAGRHWAHLPWRALTLVHAVQKPLASPQVTSLVAAKTLGNSFATLSGKFDADHPSSSRVQFMAKWSDLVDDPAKPAPETRDRTAMVGESVVPEAVAPVEVLESDGTPLRQEFHDTHYHRVGYTPVAVTRFREYFPTATNTPAATTLAGPEFAIDVANSLRPDAPKFLYALPLFEWDSAPGTPGVLERTRSGGGLRLYLDRPWYSSGDGELLGVVFLPGVDFPRPEDPRAPFVTVWGGDPIWRSQRVPEHANPPSFDGAAQVRAGLSLPDSGPVVSVAGYVPAFDPGRKLWRADVRIDTGDTYWPFVRLALARFQPNSVADAHLSPVLRSDFIQVPPRRHAKIEVAEPVLKIAVDGPVHSGSEAQQTFFRADNDASNGFNEIEAVVERFVPGTDPDDPLSWTAIESTRTVLLQDPTALGAWQGTITLPEPLTAGGFRLSLREFEWLRSDDVAPDDARRGKLGFARRLVYADAFALPAA